MVGRGLRKSPGKENCIVLDFTDTGNNLNNIISLSKAIPEAQQLKESLTKNIEEKRARNFNVEEHQYLDEECLIYLDALLLFGFKLATKNGN